MQPEIHVKEHRRCAGIITACFKIVLQCVKILTKKYRNSESIDNLSETFFKLILKSMSKFQKFEKLKIRKVFPKSCFYTSLPSDSLQFQKDFMKKSETCFGFKLLGNH